LDSPIWICVVAGRVGSSKDWTLFEERWQRASGGVVFHGTEFFRRDPRSWPASLAGQPSSLVGRDPTNCGPQVVIAAITVIAIRGAAENPER